jgi:hypothetical protein
MSKTTVTLNNKVSLSGNQGADDFISTLILKDMVAGDYFDAARDAPENASRAELEARVAAICADVPFAVIRRLSMPDYAKVSAWYDAQWHVSGSGGVKTNDPLPDGAKPAS